MIFGGPARTLVDAGEITEKKEVTQTKRVGIAAGPLQVADAVLLPRWFTS